MSSKLSIILHKSLARWNESNEQDVHQSVVSCWGHSDEEENAETEMDVDAENEEKWTHGAYGEYNDDQVTRLLNLVASTGMSAAAAGRLVGIVEKTSQYYVRKYNENQRQEFPTQETAPKRRGPKPKLGEARAGRFVQFIDDNPTPILSDITDDLCKAFDSLSITPSAVHNHLVSRCAITLKEFIKSLLPENLNEL
ncbi:hypothetical protein DFQ30_008978 [Apophysomyces sp. BC1015]|nr:hypothetical protein DFQ30_008978 [Apophysomyces sp. BC1015]KAG0175344.1 hypothetical protein DFQ29_007164 [Apophysomyces sp. BC1021]